MKIKFKLELYHLNQDGNKGDCFSVVGGSADSEDVDAAINYLMKLKEQRQENIK